MTKERPILFSAEMVRAILDGRKTQTRRVMKPQPIQGESLEIGIYAPTMVDRHGEEYPGPEGWGASNEYECIRCPYGKVGEKLWVRETLEEYPMPNLLTGEPSNAIVVRYVADREPVLNEHGFDYSKWWKRGKKLPAIFMPRWASRITLEITEVRVQRLQETSADDAIAEGFVRLSKDRERLFKYGIPDRDGMPYGVGWPWEKWRISPIDAYQALWESINGAGSWDANPWVWAISFRRISDFKSEDAHGTK